MIFKIFATHLYIIEKHLLLKYLNEKRKKKTQKLRKERNQKSFSEYDWEKLIDCEKIRTLTHNNKYLNKYLHHYSIEDLKKV